MASIYELKPAFQSLLRPLVRRLAERGVTANQVTLAACALSIATGGVMALLAATHPGALLALPIVLFLRMALNAIDGMLAREHAMKSALGGFLNELTDVVSDAALYLPLAVLPSASASLVVVLVLLSVISEMTGVVAVAQGASRRYDGPMGKSDRAFTIGAIALVLGAGFDLGAWLNVLLAVIVGLLALTVVNRIRAALREVP